LGGRLAELCLLILACGGTVAALVLLLLLFFQVWVFHAALIVEPNRPLLAAEIGLALLSLFYVAYLFVIEGARKAQRL